MMTIRLKWRMNNMNSRELMGMTVKELKEICYWRGLLMTGSKFNLVSRIMNDEVSE